MEEYIAKLESDISFFEEIEKDDKYDIDLRTAAVSAGIALRQFHIALISSLLPKEPEVIEEPLK
jgi:hypothetical protein